jgi:phosphomannomutase
VFHELGAEVITIGNQPDGLNINEDCGATAPKRWWRRCANTAPTSASRWTAMPTA